ncbi:adenylyltransferase/cytidyltransferase family protein [Pseudonocardia parietis]|uniref:FAD synthase n=1 Tax=Pseudonocardia parietis TaxID=570936 RepID=A0ABS4VMT6_9PSEU|nr:adenylyltransferase/cytidyltransferase family protein [Pseudonocardia parietis]MBP2365063.1 riboflavin kinase/FMN adenylyltransferase [Pseudonocardia parietis]
MVVLGVFDGLHRGHVRVLAHARALADARRRPVVLVTFDPHPATVAGPDRDTTPIVSLAERVRLADRNGADHILVLPFDRCLAAVEPEQFAHHVLVETLHATAVVVGENFRFGRGGTGDVTLLHQIGREARFTVHGMPLLTGCSSTQVRKLIRFGDLSGAACLLGRPHHIEGWVVDGRIHPDSHRLLPPSGRYHVHIDDHPTVAEIEPDGTVHVADRPDGPVTVWLVRRIENSTRR